MESVLLVASESWPGLTLTSWISGPESDCIHHVLTTTFIQRLPVHKWPAHGLFLLMQVMSWSCCQWQLSWSEHGQYKLCSPFYPWSRQWQQKGKQKLIAALTTSPSGWFQCASVSAWWQWQQCDQNLCGGFMRAVLPMTVKASAQAIAANGKTKHS